MRIAPPPRFRTFPLATTSRLQLNEFNVFETQRLYGTQHLYSI